jgi:hypothetical protein
MSRTDKDAPFWVRAEYYVPDHDWCCPDRTTTILRDRPRADHCTLPEAPIRADVRRIRMSKRQWDVPQCRWVPDGWDRRYYTWPPRQWDRKIYFHGPNRCGVRDFGVKVKQLYNGCGDVADVVEPGRRPDPLAWWD